MRKMDTRVQWVCLAMVLAMGCGLAGCLTVGLDSEFLENTTEYRPDGSVETETITQWTQNAKGGPFTDIESMKQDTSYFYEGDAGKYLIGQGSGASGVSGAGQVEAIRSGFELFGVAIAVARDLGFYF